MNFEDKVRSMSAKEIILAMIEGLENPAVEIDMHTFGDHQEDICYGCAATNAICKISGVKFTPENINSTEDRAIAVNSDFYFLDSFESAIEYLRFGNISGYNLHAENNFAYIKYTEIDLPRIGNKYNQDDLNQYRLLAEAQSDETDLQS